MNFKSWAEKYYPNENKNVLHKMSHAWAAGHATMAASQPAAPVDESCCVCGAKDGELHKAYCSAGYGVFIPRII